MNGIGPLYDFAGAVRAVTSTAGMTADFYRSHGFFWPHRGLIINLPVQPHRPRHRLKAAGISD